MSAHSAASRRIPALIALALLSAPGISLAGSDPADGADASWFESATGGIARAEYAPSANANGFQAPNRAQNLRTSFESQGIEVTPRSSATSTPLAAPAWRFSWNTSGIGRSGLMRPVTAVPPRVEGTRVVYSHDGWCEWYENTAKGLEQAFTIDRRPGGAGRLEIAGELLDGLEARSALDGGIDFFDAHGARVLHYGELHAWDARKTSLSAQLRVSACELSIVIDDRNADHPITIDPLLTSTAGDVNGDGFSDVIVSAMFYDNGQNNEGRAFVYHASPNGLSVNPAWTAESDQAIAQLGYCVATAGGVDGDGLDDVIAGAWVCTNGQANEGRAFLYLGTPSGLSPTTSRTQESNAQFARGRCRRHDGAWFVHRVESTESIPGRRRDRLHLGGGGRRAALRHRCRGARACSARRWVGLGRQPHATMGRTREVRRQTRGGGL